MATSNPVTNVTQATGMKADSKHENEDLPQERQTKPALILVLGPPGSGKGTLCSFLAQERGLLHFSVGDYLRQLAEHHPDIAEHVSKAKLLPTKTILGILANKISKEWSAGNADGGILLDGFPRRLDQALEFEEMFKPLWVLHVHCPDSVSRQRFLSRKLPGRLDDDEALFNKRIAEFNKNEDVIQHFREQGILTGIDSSGTLRQSQDRAREVFNGNPLRDRLAEAISGKEVLQSS